MTNPVGFVCDCKNLQFKTIDDLIKHVEKEHRQGAGGTKKGER